MSNCVVCEKGVSEHPVFKNIYFCVNERCSRLGLLSVFILTQKPSAPKEEVKDDKNIPSTGDTGADPSRGGPGGR